MSASAAIDTGDETEYLNAILTLLLQGGPVTAEGDKTSLDRTAIISSINEVNRQLPHVVSCLTSNEAQATTSIEDFEESLAVLRRHLATYGQSLAEEVRELLSIRDELQSLISSKYSNNFYSRLLVVLSLVATRQQQLQRDAQILRTLTTSSLDTIYSDADTERISEVMNQISHALSSRMATGEERAFQAAVYGCGGLDDDYDAALTNGTDDPQGNDELNVVPAPPSVISNPSNTGNAKSFSAELGIKAEIANAKSLHQVVDAFLETSPTLSAFATVFVIGDPGTGKTFLCNGIKRILDEAGVHGAFVLSCVRETCSDLLPDV